MSLRRKKFIIITIILTSVIIIIGGSIGIWIYIKEKPHHNSSWSFKISGNIIGGEFNITINELLQMPQYNSNYIIRGKTAFAANFQGVKISYLFINEINISQNATQVILIAEDSYQ